MSPSVVAVFAIATVPYFGFVAGNADQGIHIGTVFVWWALTVSSAVTLLLIVGRLHPQWSARLAAFMVPLLWWLFRYPDAQAVAPQAPRLAWLTMAVAIAATMVLLNRSAVIQALSVIIPVALAFTSGVPAIAAFVSTSESATTDDAVSTALQASVGGRNVWLFLVDAYTSPSEVADLTGRSIGQFVNELESRGFDVAEEARANYPLTYLSVASLLDMDYLAYDGDSVTSRTPFYDRIQGDNATVATLTRWGYRYVHSSPGSWDGSVCSGREDLCIAPSTVTSETSTGLAAMTPLAGLARRDERMTMARHSNPRVIAERVRHARLPSPYFVFAHLLSAHPPFLRDADCNVRRDEAISLSGEGATPAKYGAAIACVNRQLLDAVDDILADDPTAIIVIQGDHGAAIGQASKGVWPDSRFDVFSAMRLPEGCAHRTRDDMSAVNVMRFVLSCSSGDPNLREHREYQADYDDSKIVRR